MLKLSDVEDRLTVELPIRLKTQLWAGAQLRTVHPLKYLLMDQMLKMLYADGLVVADGCLSLVMTLRARI